MQLRHFEAVFYTCVHHVLNFKMMQSICNPPSFTSVLHHPSVVIPFLMHFVSRDSAHCHLRRETSPRKIVCHATPSWWWSAVGSATRPTPRRPRPCLSPGTRRLAGLEREREEEIACLFHCSRFIRRLHLPISWLHFYHGLNQHFPLYPLHFNTLIKAWWELVIANSWICSHPFASGQYLAGCGALTRGVRIGLHRVLCVCEAPQMRQDPSYLNEIISGGLPSKIFFWNNFKNLTCWMYRLSRLL